MIAPFLPDKAPGSDLVYVRSSDVDRCLISVQSLLQGTFKPRPHFINDRRL
jgi:hypothetical protein